MNEDVNVQLSLQRQQVARDSELADKLRRSVDIVNERKRRPLSETPTVELLQLQKDIGHELASRRERADIEFARITKERTALHRAGIVKPRAVRRDKGKPRPQLRLSRVEEP